MNDNEIVNDQIYCFAIKEIDQAQVIVVQKCDIQKQGIRWHFVDLFSLTGPLSCASSSAIKKLDEAARKRK